CRRRLAAVTLPSSATATTSFKCRISSSMMLLRCVSRCMSPPHGFNEIKEWCSWMPAESNPQHPWKEDAHMNTLKNIVRAMVILLTTSCVVHAGGPKTSQNITLDDAVSVNGQALKAGDAEVRWTTHSPQATVTFV